MIHGIKKNKWIYWLLCIFLVIVIFSSALWKSRIFPSKEGFDKPLSQIPNIIWTFWDDTDISPFVKKCIGSWQKYNPEYTIIVLNRQNVAEYLPEIDLLKIKGINDSVQRFADFVRLHILSKYGGFWLDASIICQAPLTFIHDIQNQSGVEYVGYYIDRFTLDKYRETSPVIENWCFACIPHSTFVDDWKKEFMKLTTFDNPREYISSVKESGINIQNLESPEYLTMHVSAQKVLQHPPNKYNLHLMRAEDSAFKHMVNEKGEWDDGNASSRIIAKTHPDQPLLKLTGYIRNRVMNETSDYDGIFV